MSNLFTRGDSHSNKRNSVRRNIAQALFAAAVAAGASGSLASTYNFTGATGGNWNVSSNWTLTTNSSTHVVPVNGDTAQLDVAGTSATSINFNETYTGVGLALLDIDNQVSNTIFNFNQTTAGTAMIATNEDIGNTNTENTYNQTAGTNTVTTTLTLGVLVGSNTNTYDLNSSGGTGTLKAATEDVGNAGTGVITQNAGSNTVTGTLSLGTASTGSGQYTLNSTGTGTGTLTAANEYIGDAGTGAVTQNAGTNTVSNALVVGNTGNGTYTLNSGNLTIAAGAFEENLGYGAGSTGLFIQNGGTHSLSNELNVGTFGTGTYDLNGGMLSMASSYEVIGFANTGTFNQMSGTNSLTVGGALVLSYTAGVTANYNLQGGSLIASSVDEIVGCTGTATLTQSGTSTNSISSVTGLVIGANTGSTGIYNLQSGTLTVSAGSEYIGGYAGISAIGPASAGATGTFTQTGGSNTISNSSASLIIGDNAGDIGTYILQSGSLSSAGGEYVGVGGTGTFTQSGTSTNTLTNSNLEVGEGTSAGAPSNTYNLQGGQLIVGGNEFIANGSPGVFNQGGGTNTITGILDMGNSANATYTLSAGTLTCTGEEIIGDSLTTTTFTQMGGINNANGGIDIAQDANGLATATYTLDAGATINAAGETVGDDGIGTFIQNGGANNVTGPFAVGSASLGDSGSSDLYTMNGGTLTVSGGEEIGPGTYGAFVQNAGTNNANGIGLFIGGNVFMSSYTLEGPAGILNATGIKVSYNGTLNVSNGVVNSPTGTLIVDSADPGFPSLFPGGQINFSGGTMTFAALNFNGTPSAFHWTGGTLALTQGITFDPGAGATTTSAAFGSSLTLNSGMSLVVTGNETIGGAGFFTLTLNAGSVDTATGLLTVAPAGILIQNGGPVAQSITNQGIFIYNGGTFSGQLVNQGLAEFELSGTIPGGLISSGNVTGLGLGVAMTFNGPGLTNSGSITMAGGSIMGTVNNAGLISGYGSIFAEAITNSGAITQSGGNLILNSITGPSNAGAISLASGLQLSLNGAGATNDGTINLNGGTLNANISLTNLTDGVVNGPGKINTVFINFGTLEIPNGTTSTGSFSNSGVIEMAGSAAVLGSNATITNAGTIEGFGKISDAITNNATIQPDGGTLVITNSVTNSSVATIALPAGGKLLMQGSFPTNAGLISLTGGTFDNGGNALNNTGSIIGYGVLSTGGTGLTNNGNITFAGGTTTVNGNVTNMATKTINIKYQPAIFTGNLTNNIGAIINTFSTSFTVGGTFTNNGTYNSDPSSNIFQSNVNSGGSMTGNLGDEFVFSGGTFNNTGTFINGGLLQSSDAITNSGTFTQSGPQNWTAGTTFTNTAGTATFNTDSGPALPPVPSPLTMVATGGVIKLNVTQHLAALSISGSGKVDMTTTQLFIATTPAAMIRSFLASAYDHGNWDLPGLTSSTIPTHAGTALGYMTISSGVEVKYTWIGDTNLDGVVNSADLSAISSTGTTWATGDFNYDGMVNADDYALFMLGSAYGNVNISTTLPEPAGVMMTCGGLLVSLLLRRRTCR